MGAGNDSLNQITFNVKTKTDTSGLDNLRKEINKLQQYVNSKPFELNTEKAETDLIGIRESITILKQALGQSYDLDLNVTDISKFNALIGKSHLTLASLKTQMHAIGPEGISAFSSLSAEMMKFNTVNKQSTIMLDKMYRTLGNTVRWGITSTLMNQVVGGVEKSLFYIKDLDTALNDIRIVTNKSSADMEQFAVSANEAAKALAVSTSDYTEGSLIYYQQGLDDKKVKALTDITAKTSNVTGQSMSEISEQLTAVWNGYQATAKIAEGSTQTYEAYVDTMAAVGASTASDLEEISIAMSKVASGANAMGLSFNQLTAQIATIVSITRQAPESVGTALKTIYARLGDLKINGEDEDGVSLGEVSTDLETVGISILDTSGQMKEMGSIMDQVAGKWDNWTKAQQTAIAISIAGKRQYNNMLALFGNWDQYLSALDTAGSASGTLEQQQEIALDSLDNKMDVLKTTAEKLYMALFDKDSLSGIIDSLTTIVDVIGDLSENLGGLKNMIPLLGSIMAKAFSPKLASTVGNLYLNSKRAKDSEAINRSNLAEMSEMYPDSKTLRRFTPEDVKKSSTNVGKMNFTASNKAELKSQAEAKVAAENEAIAKAKASDALNTEASMEARKVREAQDSVRVDRAAEDGYIVPPAATSKRQQSVNEITANAVELYGAAGAAQASLSEQDKEKINQVIKVALKVTATEEGLISVSKNMRADGTLSNYAGIDMDQENSGKISDDLTRRMAENDLLPEYAENAAENTNGNFASQTRIKEEQIAFARQSLETEIEQNEKLKGSKKSILKAFDKIAESATSASEILKDINKKDIPIASEKTMDAMLEKANEASENGFTAKASQTAVEKKRDYIVNGAEIAHANGVYTQEEYENIVKGANLFAKANTTAEKEKAFSVAEANSNKVGFADLLAESGRKLRDNGPLEAKTITDPKAAYAASLREALESEDNTMSSDMKAEYEKVISANEGVEKELKDLEIAITKLTNKNKKAIEIQKGTAVVNEKVQTATDSGQFRDFAEEQANMKNEFTDSIMTQVVNNPATSSYGPEQLAGIRTFLDEIGNESENIDDYIEKINQRVKETKKEVSEVNEKVSESSATVGTVGEMVSKARKTVDLKSTLTTVSRVSSSIGQIAFGVQSLTSAFKQVGETVDPLKQLVAIVEGLAFGLGPAIGGIVEVVGVLDAARATMAAEQGLASMSMASYAKNFAKLNPYIVAITAAIAIGTAVYAAYHMAQTRVVEANKELIETSKELNKEMAANETIYKSYTELYNQYKEGAATKEDMTEATTNLVDAYDIENGQILAMIGNYDQLKIAADKARAAQLKDAVKKDKIALNAIKENNAIAAGDGVGQGYYWGSQRYHGGAADSTLFKGVDEVQDAFIKELRKLDPEMLNSYINSDSGLVDYNVNTFTKEEAADKFVTFQKAMDNVTAMGYDFNTSKSQGLYNFISNVKANSENTNAYIDKKDETASNLAAKYALTNSPEDATNLKDFQTKMDAFKKDLSSDKTFKTLGVSVNDYVEKFAVSLNNEFSNAFLAQTTAVDRIKSTLPEGEDRDKLLDYIQNTKGDDAEFAASLTSLVTYAGIKTVQDLKDALVSGNVLNTRDSAIAEALTELSKSVSSGDFDEGSLTVVQDAFEGLENFKNKTQQEQYELLQDLTQQQNDESQTYLKDWDVALKKSLAFNEKQKENIKEKLLAIAEKNFKPEEISGVSDLKDLDWASLNLSDEATDQIELLMDGLDQVEVKTKNIKETLADGWFNDISNQQILEDAGSGLDSFFNELASLKEATDLVGEGWVVAADNVDTFLEKFPLLSAQAEIYADGSMKLNQEVFQSHLNMSRDEMEADEKAYEFNLDQQIAALQLEKDLNKIKRDNLIAILQGKKTAAEGMQEIDKATLIISNKQQDLKVQKDDDASKYIVENVDEVTAKTLQGIDDVGSAFNELSNAKMQMAKGFASDYTNQINNKSNLQYSGRHSKYSLSSDSNNYNQELYDLVSDQDGDSLQERIQAEINSTLIEDSALQSSIDTLNSNKARARAALANAQESFNNANSGVGNGDSGSTDSISPKEQKYFDDEFDRYWELNKAIQEVTDSLTELNDLKDNSFKGELVDNLENQNKLLEEQADRYNDLINAQKQEMRESQALLGQQGVSFNGDGSIGNYQAASSKALSSYNSAVSKYNAGALSEEGFDIAETVYENFKDDLSRYEDLYYSEMEDANKALKEIREKQLDNNLTVWETKLEIQLDLSQAERDWNDFFNGINDDFNKLYQNLYSDFKKVQSNFETFTDEGTLIEDVQAIKDVEKEIDKMKNGDSSNMFATISEAQKRLTSLGDTLKTDSQSVFSLYQEAWTIFFSQLDQAKSKFSDIISSMSRIGAELTMQEDLIQKIYGKETFDLLDKVYKAQEQNNFVQIESLKQQKDMWYNLYLTAEKGSKEQNAYYENWTAAQDSLNSSLTAYIELLKTDYSNAMSDVLDQLERYLSGSTSFDSMSDDWDKVKEHSDKYLDSVEGLAKVQKFANTIDAEIANSGTLEYQQKLQALKEKELETLAEKGELTQYDLDLANAHYDIAMKEQALEDARNVKDSMKLSRGADGNWSYQYMSDSSDVLTKQQALTDSYTALYNLSKTAYQSNLESLQSLQTDYLASYKAILESETMTELEKDAKIMALKTYYYQQYAELAAENSAYRNDLSSASAGLLLSIYDEDLNSYGLMTEAEKELVNDLKSHTVESYADLQALLEGNYDGIGEKATEIMASTLDEWQSGAQQIADAWNADDGYSVKAQIEQAISDINDAFGSYQDKINEVGAAVDRNFNEDGITQAIVDAQAATEALTNSTTQLVDSTLGILADYKNAINEIENAWFAVKDSISKAIDELQIYINLLTGKNTASPSTSEKANSSDSSANKSSVSGTNGDGKIAVGDKATLSGKYYYDSGGRAPAGSKYSGTKDGVVIDKVNDNSYGVHIHSADGKYKDLGWVKPSQLSGYDTGGYTGDWSGNDGKLALLHSKEIVLNAKDTQNMLGAIEAVRSISSISDSMNDSITQGIMSMIKKFVTPDLVSNITPKKDKKEGAGNNYTINAEFPNANDVNSIKEAILSLPNLASQYIHKK